MRIVSYIILGIIVLVYFSSLNMYDTGSEFLNYQLRTAYHANTEHLLANAVSFFALSFMEDVIGSKQFLIAIIFIWIVSSTLLYLYHKIFPSRKVYTVGFSGVIFGLFVVYYSLLGSSTSVTIFII